MGVGTVFCLAFLFCQVGDYWVNLWALRLWSARHFILVGQKTDFVSLF